MSPKADFHDDRIDEPRDFEPCPTCGGLDPNKVIDYAAMHCIRCTRCGERSHIADKHNHGRVIQLESQEQALCRCTGSATWQIFCPKGCPGA